MSASMRAALIAMLGPAVSALGVVWVLANVLIDTGRELTFRYVVFDPGHLVIAAGVLISTICIPVALEVAAAEPADLEAEVFEPEQGQRERAPRPRGEWGEAMEWE